MKIKRRNLSDSLKHWLTSEVGLGPGTGEVHYLCKAATDNYYTWLQENGVCSDNLHLTLETAYAALTANKNDTLIVLPGSHTVSSAFTWGKDFTHMVGAAAPTQVNQQCRFATSGNAITPMITFSADGSIMKNVMWSQDGTHATTAAVNMYMTGARNYLENVTMRNLGELNLRGTASRCLKLGSSDAENTFVRCTIGADTVDATTGSPANIEYETGLQNARNVFRECILLGSGAASGVFILASGAQSVNSFQLFERCLFFNNDVSDMDAMTQAFNIGATCGGFFILMDCLVYGASAYETSNSGVLYGRHSYAAATTDVAVALTY